MSIATHGADAFHNQANYKPVAQLLPESGQSGALPFRYLDPGHRSVDVDFRVRAPDYGNRTRSFNTYFHMKTTLAYRSASILRSTF